MSVKNASDAQIRFLHAWRKDVRLEVQADFKEFMSSVGEGGSIEDLTMQQASQIISQMVANHSEPKKGQDDLKNGDKDHRGEGHDGEGDGDQEQDGDGDGDGEGEEEYENPYRENSKSHLIADILIKNDLDRMKSWEEIAPQIGEKPLEYRGNLDGEGLKPLPIGSKYDPVSAETQNGRGKKDMHRIADALEAEGKKEGEKKQGDGQGQDQDQKQGQGQGNGGGGKEDDATYVIKKITHGQIIWAEQNAEGEPAKDVGMRPAIYAAKMLNGGFPAKMILDAIMMDWPKEIRRSVMEKPGSLDDALAEYKAICGKPDDKYCFDVTKLWKGEQTEDRHPATPAIVRSAKIGIPTLMVGGHGTGKTHIAESVNTLLNAERGTSYQFGFASMTAGTSPGEFKGRITLDGFLPSLFEDIFANGGVFLFDELDAGEANLLTLLNSALANGYFVNNKGQRLTAHEHFMPLAAGNTMGLGANRKYVGRNRLDAATLDRWVKIRIEFSKALESRLYWDIIASKNA